jgi:hypothetical protein
MVQRYGEEKTAKRVKTLKAQQTGLGKPWKM